MRSAALLLFTGLFAAGCGPAYIEGTKIEHTDEREEIAKLIERYRIAVEQRDADALRAMASNAYYENGSTTENPSDDYDFNGLSKVLDDIRSTVKRVRYEIDLTDIQVMEDTAIVDFDYRTQYLYVVGEQDRWETATDRNRLTFRRERGEWRIVSGL